MRKWGYGINSLHKQANIHIDEAPWWVFALDDLVEAICDIIPFPNIRLELKDPSDIEFYGGQWTTWNEWHGDLKQYFHVSVHRPIFEFCQNKIKTKSVDITYDQARDMFYEHDKKFFDQEAERVESCEDAAVLPFIEAARSEYKEKGGRPWNKVQEQARNDDNIKPI
ncbi:MAG: hypothetical protein ABSA18_09970 [Dehalococcoidia bacterium]|jgi:hypothetical protein